MRFYEIFIYGTSDIIRFVTNDINATKWLCDKPDGLFVTTHVNVLSVNLGGGGEVSNM